MWPDDEGVVNISDPCARFDGDGVQGLLLQACLPPLGKERGEPISAPSRCSKPGGEGPEHHDHQTEHMDQLCVVIWSTQ